VLVPVLWDQQTGSDRQQRVERDPAHVQRGFGALAKGDVDLYPAPLRDGDRPHQRLRLRQHQQRRVPLRLRHRAGRRTSAPFDRLFSALDRVEGAARAAALAGGAKRRPKRTGACSPRWAASMRCTSATSSATATGWRTFRSFRATCARCTWCRASPDTVNIDHIKRHYYMSHPHINPTRIVPAARG
jgi:putative glutathione S-transferase